MPHARKRHLESWIAKFIKASPSISLIGQRQTGKTTLLRQHAKQVFFLDKESVRADLERNLDARLKAGPFPILLDEAQKLPKVFDEIKALMDERRIPGRYLLTGSVRLNSKKLIQESLTGRTLVLELLPLGVAETHRRPLGSFWDVLLKAPSLGTRNIWERIQGEAWLTQKGLESHLACGGLPGICFQRDSILRDELYQSHIDTLLGRDLQQVYAGSLSVVKTRLFLSLIAQRQGERLNLSELARKVGTTSPTLAKYLAAFEKLFLIREISSRYYFEDPGMANTLCTPSAETALQRLKGFVFCELQQQLHYRYRSQLKLEGHYPRRGVEIPFILHFREPSRRIAIVVEIEKQASTSSLKALTWYLKSRPDTMGLVLHQGEQATTYSDKVAALPMRWIV
jgi:predicted AAA+ superfamily ATPase